MTTVLRIVPNQDFRHGGIQFLKGENYIVSSEDAQYFAAVEWIGELPSKSDDQTLDIHDLELGQSTHVL